MTILALAAWAPPTWPVSGAGDEAVHLCASRFGAALRTGNVSELRSILPARGKVQVRLERFGPEEGFYSASQVEAIFANFLKRCSLESFEIQHVEYDSKGYALVRGRARLVNESGRREEVELRLALQPEGDNWVLREIRETRR